MSSDSFIPQVPLNASEEDLLEFVRALEKQGRFVTDGSAADKQRSPLGTTGPYFDANRQAAAAFVADDSTEGR